MSHARLVSRIVGGLVNIKAIAQCLAQLHATDSHAMSAAPRSFLVVISALASVVRSAPFSVARNAA